MSHRSRPLLAGLVALLLVGAAPPDDRLTVEAEPDIGADGGRLRLHGNAGAVGYDSGVDAGEDGAQVTNPPMHSSFGTAGGEREELYGPPVATAALGTGGLTASLRGDGVLTNLSWPGPGLYEHVNYRHTTRDWPNEGAAENAGSMAGLLLPDGSGTWLTRTDGWEVVSQGYDGRGSGVLRTVLARDGVEVTIRDVVHPTLDVLARDIETRGAPDGTSLAYVANMNPTTSRTPRVPSTTDGLLDDASDFATVHEPGSQTMLHFRPRRLDPSAATVAATGGLGIAPTADALEATFGNGVYIAVAGQHPPAAVQAGVDSVGLARDEAEGTGGIDPFYDARDGELSGSRAAFGKTAGAQRWDDASGTVFLAADDTPTDVVATIDEARRLGFDGVRRAADRDWDRWLSTARLPASDDEQVRAVAERALMLIRTAQDRRTGAIVANTTTQTPYRQDWVRDGAFFNYALLVAGYDDMVARHNDFYRRAQSATGHWDPILCTDGAHCSAVFPFEIDAQAFGVWALWLEYELTGDRDRLATNYDAIRRGTEVLYACQDPATGLQCIAHEDDSLEASQGAQGAATVYLGLRSAARAADVLGEHGERDRWNARADELQQAAVDELCDERCPLDRGGIYLVWPSKLLLDEAPLQPTLDAFGRQLARRVSHEIPGQGGFFQYPMEPLFALATAWTDTDEHASRLDDALAWLAHDVVDPGVLHYGERIFHRGGDDYLHSVGFPHIWSGAETYLAATLVDGVERCRPGVRLGDVACGGHDRPAPVSPRPSRTRTVSHTSSR